ncbi:C1QC-like protein [Mya arenaria]|uniref:C1QC-like protein n=1 Tax=Mya arenaria TaxID=6604 RepID=A0ABY7DCJ9_MYAAR|nr:complement C1q-like protein 2 [Mya arenaria]WAQ94643.1 C1QC-like protein [Mya arenaria]
MNPVFIGALLTVCLSNGVHGKAKPCNQQHRVLLSKVKRLQRTVKELQQHQSLEMRTDKDELSQLAGPAELTNVQYDSGESGFHVTLDKPQEIETKMPLKFDDVVTNIGGAYDTQTGIYTAPVTGTYMFTLNAVCAARNFLHLAIYKNDAPAFNVICDDLKGDIQHQGGGTTILRLQRGDKIYVTLMFPLGTVGEVRGNGITSFSGYLLKEL